VQRASAVGARRLFEYPVRAAEPAQRRQAVPDRAVTAVDRQARQAERERPGGLDHRQRVGPGVRARALQPPAAAARGLRDGELLVVLAHRDFTHVLLEQECAGARELGRRHALPLVEAGALAGRGREVKMQQLVGAELLQHPGGLLLRADQRQRAIDVPGVDGRDSLAGEPRVPRVEAQLHRRQGLHRQRLLLAERPSWLVGARSGRAVRRRTVGKVHRRFGSDGREVDAQALQQRGELHCCKVALRVRRACCGRAEQFDQHTHRDRQSAHHERVFARQVARLAVAFQQQPCGAGQIAARERCAQ
jgi:hypothetical protein